MIYIHNCEWWTSYICIHNDDYYEKTHRQGRRLGRKSNVSQWMSLKCISLTFVRQELEETKKKLKDKWTPTTLGFLLPQKVINAVIWLSQWLMGCNITLVFGHLSHILWCLLCLNARKCVYMRYLLKIY